jgi:cysteine desulfurase
MQEIYLDNNATTRPLPEVVEAMLEPLRSGFGNPSSAHSAGDRARERLRTAREAVAELIAAEASDVVFAGSGTEANNMVLASVLATSQKTPRIVTTTVEHSSVLRMCEHLESSGVEVVYLPVNGDGCLSLADVEEAVTPETGLVSIQWVNNETGVILPVEEIGALCRERGVLLHTDAAQAVGKLKLAVSLLPVDFLSLTAHKFHGPQGVGALCVRDRRRLQPLLHGGDQEAGLRPGTENLPGIVGLGKAAALRAGRLGSVVARLTELRDLFEQDVLSAIPGTKVNGDTSRRICNTTNLRFPEVHGEAMVARLDQVGVLCSQSSACTNQRPEPSYVLRAMGLSEQEAYASIRFSVSELNTKEEVQVAAARVVEVWEQLHAFQARRRVAAPAP